MKYFIEVLQNGLGFTLILSGLYALLDEKDKKKKTVLLSFILGLIGALIFTYLRSEPSLNKIRGNLSFTTMSVVFGLSVLYILLGFSIVRSKLPKLAALCESVLTPLINIAMLTHYLPTLILYTKDFMPYGQDTMNTEIVLRIIFWLLGLAFLVLVSWALNGSIKRLDKDNVRFLVRLAFFFNMIFQFALVLQRLYALRLIPREKWIFAFFAFGVNNENMFTFVSIVVLTVIPIILWFKNRKVKEEYNNPAELRKIKAGMRSARRWSAFFVIMVIAASLTLSVVKFYYEREVELSPPEEFEMRGDNAVIPLELLEDEHLHRFEYVNPQGIHVRFIALKKNSGGNYTVCFDACEICGASGYYERKDQIVCKLCDVVMNRGTIGFEGGCNPIPMKFTLGKGEILVSVEELEKEANRFK